MRLTPGVLAAVAAALLVATWAAFGRILAHGFVFDDYALIVTNAGIRGLDPARLRWMFSSTYLTTYMPLGWAALAAVHAFSGLAPSGYHAANLLAHWLVALALFLVARELFVLGGDKKPDVPAFAAALIFCVHPFQTNTVAWAIELPDMLSTLMYLSAVFIYLRDRSRASLTAVLGLYLVSLLFRWKSISLPVVLVALDYWPLKRLHAKTRVEVWAEKAPFFILAVAAASVTMLAKRHEASVPSFAPGTALRALWLFPWALLKPWGYLSAYPLHGAGDPFWLQAWGAFALTAAVAVAAWRYRRASPWLAPACVVYAAAVLPPALFSQDGWTAVFLAYGYLGCLGAFVLAGSLARGSRGLAVAVASSAVFVVLSREEARHWSDPVAFWTRAVELDPRFSPAQGLLGDALYSAGRYREALPYLAARLAWAPDDAVAKEDLAALLLAAPELKEEAARLTARAASSGTRR